MDIARALAFCPRASPAAGRCHGLRHPGLINQRRRQRFTARFPARILPFLLITRPARGGSCISHFQEGRLRKENALIKRRTKSALFTLRISYCSCCDRRPLLEKVFPQR